MATSTGKTIGLILLVIFILAMAWRITPLIVGPFGFFSGALHMLGRQGGETFHLGPSLLSLTNSMLSLALLFIWIFVIVWVYRDAERRGMNGILWALLVLIGNIIGLLIYLIVRSDGIPALKPDDPPQASCPSCQKEVDSAFVFCPYCAARIHAVCPECGKATEENWKACPHCGKKLKE